MFFYLSLFLIFISSLKAISKQDCLKKIEDIVLFKEIEPIDAIYVINLDHRPEKFLNCQFYFNKYKLVANRFSAIDGRSISREVLKGIGLVYAPCMKPLLVKFSPAQPIPEQLEDEHLGTTCFYRHITWGAIGCYLSHISILKDAFDQRNSIKIFQIFQNQNTIDKIIVRVCCLNRRKVFSSMIFTCLGIILSIRNI